jgi:hypothetical protein
MLLCSTTGEETNKKRLSADAESRFAFAESRPVLFLREY